MTGREKLHLGLMLALTFSTGIVDAIGYLGLDRVFTGNMTGNVVILGMALAGADDLPVIGPVIALLGFMLGAALAGRTLRREKGWGGRTTAVFTAVGVFMTGTAIALAIMGGGPETVGKWDESLAWWITGIMAVAMGGQAAGARHIAVKDVTTVVVTSTITGFAQDSWLGGGKGQPWFRRFAAIVLIGAGAGVGALLLMVHMSLGVAVCAVISLAVAIYGFLHNRRERKLEAAAEASEA